MVGDQPSGQGHSQGIGDAANQFHYYRLSADNRIVWGGYDAVYHFGRRVDPMYEDRLEVFRRLAGCWTYWAWKGGYFKPTADQITERVGDPVDVMVAAAVGEELLFRGLVFSGLRRLGPVAAVVLSALLFGVAHASIYRFLPTFFLGLVLGLTRLRSRSIVPGMIIHALNNGIAVGLIHFKPSWAESAVTRGSLSIGATAAATVILSNSCAAGGVAGAGAGSGALAAQGRATISQAVSARTATPAPAASGAAALGMTPDQVRALVAERAQTGVNIVAE